MKPYCILSDLCKSYPTPVGDAIIVNDFNLKIDEGEFVSIIGHSRSDLISSS